MSQFDPLRSDKELPLEHGATLLDEHEAELNYINALLWILLTKPTSDNEAIKECVIQGEKQCLKIIQARNQESNPARAILWAIKRREERLTDTTSNEMGVFVPPSRDQGAGG